jgi:hypothetical protein
MRCKTAPANPQTNACHPEHPHARGPVAALCDGISGARDLQLPFVRTRTTAREPGHQVLGPGATSADRDLSTPPFR